MSSPSAVKRAPRVVLGVTGGIAAYKSCELVRLMRKAGWEVRVVMTRQAENFVGALTFASLSGNPVLRALEVDAASDLSATAHIDLAQWGDALVVAPATANFLAKLVTGICDDALSTEALAFTNPIFVAPAMNTRMWEAAATRENRATLAARGVRFVGPVAGDLACGETGEGKMAEPGEIFAALAAALGVAALRAPAETITAPPLAGARVLITSGPTRAYIDSVRFLTNRSSGRMGHALATVAAELGAHVTLVTGPVDEKFATLASGEVVRVETNAEMLAAAERAFPKADIVIGAAAVADFAPAHPISGKLERKDALKLELEPTTDILGTLTKARRPGQIFVAFAAETGDEAARFDRARAKLERKGVDIVALNDVGRADIGFDSDANEAHVFQRVNASGTAEVTQEFLPRAPKQEIARALLAIVARRWRAEKSL